MDDGEHVTRGGDPPEGSSQAEGSSWEAASVRAGGERRARGRARGVEAIAKRLQTEVPWKQRLVHWREAPARPGRTEAWPARLDPRLVEVFQSRGILEPYAHQAQAIDAALRGEDVLVATPTASGKTVCYTAPVIQSLLESGGSARALFLYPTKALSQDQTVGLTALVEELVERFPESGAGDWHAFTYDGDTPPAVRRTLRDRGHMVLTNPYMLHQGILPNHAKWAELFRDLRYVVVDEVHTLSGVFGSSVANVLRRLLRIARHYGANPKFLASSATIADPRAHAERLFGRPFTVIDEDASPSGKRIFGVYEPEIVNSIAGLRANALEEARELAKEVVGPSHQSIFFCGRRTAVEVLTRYLKENAKRLGLKPSEIRGYRGGYLPDMRREIETGLKNGQIKVVVSTNALELGVDIGALDVAVLVGYPGSQASFWQRAGRVGRRGKPSLVIQIARSEPVDQFLVHHPEYLFEAPREKLGVDPDNLVLLSEHVKCAAFELPFHAEEGGDGEYGDGEDQLANEPEFGLAPHVPEILDYLSDESGFLHRRQNTWYWMADSYPAQDVSLAGGDIDNVLILEAGTERAIGETDRESSITTVHEGAIYQVQGVTWRVERFDYKNRRAYVREVESDYYTDAQTDTEVRVLRLEDRLRRSRAALGVVDPDGQPAAGDDHSAWRGEVHVTTVATLYKKIRFYTRENVGSGDIQLPPEELDTEAFILTMSEEAADDIGLAGGERGSAWRALGELMRRVAPLFIRCQPSDLGLSSQIKSPHFGQPTIFLYDKVQGGVGLGELLFAAHRSMFTAALDVVSRCSCEIGCPACVGPVAEVGPLGKEIVTRLLEHLGAGPAPEPADPEAADSGEGFEDDALYETSEAEFGPLPRGMATEGL
ncbi:ATP-dependent RNA helicase DbpA [Planctomycetes bacterium Poly30]|uniref:ATP-dependent RNA helicase DbpA n=1 Tax=Saltatorellus ferox TaxID=2528018 RepID=A0A518ETQ4_9BACT|nr:ATP-dependent RNA helicase DbpA [Planctomycetes bacterium Poly30]